MDHAAPRLTLAGRPLWVKILTALVLLVLALVLLVVFFPWDLLREPLNRYVTERTGRHFAITRKLDVKVGRTTRILADGIEFANPDWAQDKYLVRAEGGEIDVRLLPLLHRRIELPLVALRKPQLGLQVEADGRRSWALGKDTGDRKNVPDIGALVVDEGTVHFVAPGHGADIRTDFAIAGPLAMPQATQQAARASAPASASASAKASASPSSEAGQAPASLPLTFNAKGTWQKEPFTARGRTGNVLYLSAPLQKPFPMEIEAAAGETRLAAHGSISSLATLDGSDAVVDLKGRNLADLYKLLGVVLPETPRYSVHGHVFKKGEVWRVQDLNGQLGNSDLAGELSYDKEQKVPHLAGKLQSKWLDFNDLAPLVGLEDKPRGPKAEQQAQQKEQQKGQQQVAQAAPDGKAPAGGKDKKDKPPRDPNRKVLPNTPLDLARLKEMNSEVHYTAARVTNLKQLPLDRIAVQVRLRDGVLNLEPMTLGVAGGTLSGRVRIDGHSNPAVAEVHLDGRSLELSKLLRNEKRLKSSFGKIHGDFDLTGRGNSVAQMLGTSSGNVSLLMGPGQISNLLLEFAGLDGGEILKFLIGGDHDVPVRCAATAFDVSKGLMTSRALVLDTVDTVIYGDGTVNLGNEAMDLYFRPYPKDTSILSLRSPIKLAGTLGAPNAGPDKGALAGRAGMALALGAVNPLLALAATIETGPGKDANCGAILRQAASPDVSAASARAKQDAQEKEAKRMGGPAAKMKSLLGLDGEQRSNRERARQPSDDKEPAKGATREPAGAQGTQDGKGQRTHAPGAPDKPYGQ